MDGLEVGFDEDVVVVCITTDFETVESLGTLPELEDETVMLGEELWVVDKLKVVEVFVLEDDANVVDVVRVVG